MLSPLVILIALAFIVSGSNINLGILIALVIGYFTVLELFLEFFYDVDSRYITSTPPIEVDVDREYVHEFLKFPEMDMSVLHRFVIDKVSGDEILIHGSPETTFREALLEYWTFSRIARHAHWNVYDAHGENITNAPLASYDGPAYITLI